MADDGLDSGSECSEPEKNIDDDGVSKRKARKFAWLSEALSRKEHRMRVKRISSILKKSESERTIEEIEFLQHSPEVAERLTKSANRRDALKQRSLEIHDPEPVLEEKCSQLATAIKNSKNIVIYTGAGISTAASIPDYRGPNGVWTLLQKGQQPVAQDLSDAEPTYTHMCILQLHKEGKLKHVVSQNCDGLHLRSGLPRKMLSEVHGNMFIELCNSCKPPREYVRLFDVTEKTGVRRHFTDRCCHTCKKPLRDTIVHFGEKGGIKSPYRWKEAAKAANNCDLILCLGTSLKILKVYSCLWCMDRRPKQRPNLYIVNLQWTPKDDSATLKINGRCDDVMNRVMDKLGFSIQNYAREYDPIFRMATPLKTQEQNSTNKKVLVIPSNYKMRGNRRKTKACDEKVMEVKPEVHSDSISVSSFPPCDVPLDLSMTGPQGWKNTHQNNVLPNTQCNGTNCSCSYLLNESSGMLPSQPILSFPLPLSYPMSLENPIHIKGVLNDHCYLNKNQMQRLSPNHDQKTPVKRCASVSEEIKTEVSASTEPDTVDTTLKDISKTDAKQQKLFRSVSVPGWFGKGLSLKKKRRI